jgi:hypothetical protein
VERNAKNHMFCCRESSSAIRNSGICEHNFINRGSRPIKSSQSDANMLYFIEAHTELRASLFHQCVTTFPIQLGAFLESFCDAPYF